MIIVWLGDNFTDASSSQQVINTAAQTLRLDSYRSMGGCSLIGNPSQQPLAQCRRLTYSPLTTFHGHAEVLLPFSTPFTPLPSAFYTGELLRFCAGHLGTMALQIFHLSLHTKPDPTGCARVATELVEPLRHSRSHSN